MTKKICPDCEEEPLPIGKDKCSKCIVDYRRGLRLRNKKKREQ